MEALEATDARDKKRIQESMMERDALLTFTEENKSQNIEENTFNQI